MKNTIVTKAQIQKMAEDSISAIERDWGKDAGTMDERLRRVLVHWMSQNMTEVRNLVLTYHRDELEAIVSRLKTQIQM